MNKSYHRRIFGGRDAQWIGVDQGKSPLYKGAVEMSMNATYDENIFKARVGQSKSALETAGAILSGTHRGGLVAIMAGTDLFVGEL